MTEFPERRFSPAARWSKRLAWFSAVLFVTVALGHRYGLVDTVATFWVLSIVVTLAMSAFGLACAGFSRLWNFGERAGRDSTKGALVAVIVLVPFLVSGYRVFAYPRLNDVSTDVVDPPPLAAATRMRTGQMNLVRPIDADAAAIQAERYPAVTGRRYALPADSVTEIVSGLVSRHGWQVLAFDRPGERDEPTPADVTLELVAGTMIFGFPSDVAIRISDEGESSYVDMRSASRFGHHDLGDNAGRIVAFLEELDREVALQAGVVPPEPAEGG